jgi:hypothetical protein
MILATLAIGFACLLTQQAAHKFIPIFRAFLKAHDIPELYHATDIFPHPNQQPKPYQKRKA